MPDTTLARQAATKTEHFDVVIVGAGISGIGGAYHLTQQEDDRLGVAAMTVLLRGAVSTDDACAWIDRLAAPWRARPTGATSAQLDNTIRFARTLHLQLTLGIRLEPTGSVRPMPDRDELLRHLGAALADVGWLYGRPA